MKIARIVLGVLIVFLAQSSFGQSWSTYGAETLPRSKNAITFDIGYPWAFRGGFIMPVTNSFEVRPTLGLWYGYATVVPDVGLLASAQLKFAFFNEDKVHVAVAAEPGVALDFYSRFRDTDQHQKSFSVGLHIGLVPFLFTYNATRDLAVHLGIRVPLAVFLGKHISTTVLIPVVFRIAVEFKLSSALSLYLGVDPGVSVAANDGHDSKFALIAVFGLAYRL